MARKKKAPTKGQLRTRAQRQASNAYAQDQAAINAAKRSARRTYHTELGASRAAKSQVKALYRSAAKNIPNRIHGLALQQVNAELASRMQDAKGMVKYEKAGLRQDLRTALQDARQQQAALDASVASEAQTNLQEALKKQREKNQAAIEKRTKYERSVRDALAEIRQAVSKTRGPGANALRIEAASLRADPSLRRNLVDYLTTSQGISTPAAKKAVSLFTRGKNTAADKAGLAATGFTGAVQGVIDRNPLWWEDKTP